MIKTNLLHPGCSRVGVAMLLAALAAGFITSCGGDSLPPKKELHTRVSALETEVLQKNSEIEARNSQIHEIETQLTEIRGLLNQREADLLKLREQAQVRLPAESAFVGIPDSERFGDQIEADRLLLVEMRKKLPEDKNEAIAFWDNIKGLSSVADPSLVARANSVISSLPAYFRFLETDFSSRQEAVLTFQLTGASEYQVATDKFWKAFALSLIERLDIVSANLES